MSETKQVKVLRPGGSELLCTLRITGNRPAQLELDEPAMPIAKSAAPDLFDALKHLRKALEGVGARILCAGARKDVYPSAMSLEMSGGRKAYLLRMGQPAQRDDLVDIFDPAEASTVATVAEQEAFHARWIGSLGGLVASAGEIAEAKKYPNGYVYRTNPLFGKNDPTPPEAVIGAWKVGPDGQITGPFTKNPKYDPRVVPRRKG